MKIASFVAVGQATQDQQIAAGVDWLDSHDGEDRECLMLFVDKLNHADGPILRLFPDDELTAVRNLAMIGLWEVCRAAVDRKRIEET